MQRINPGDICPICGQRVTTDDPETLETLSALAQIMERLGLTMKSEGETR